MLFMDYVGAGQDATAALRDGDWLSVRDLGTLDAEGRLCLAGRQNRMIVTQGKNLFAEELESVLEAHPAIALASVHGMEDARRGALVVAILHWADDSSNGNQAQSSAVNRPDALQLMAWCRQRLEAFKAPKKFFVCAQWPLTAGGKTDHAVLARSLERHGQHEQHGQPGQRNEPTTVDTPCLHRLP